MLVEEIMKKDAVTLGKDATIEEAMLLLEKHRIRHIPILEEDNTIAGIVSDRDVRDASPSIFHTNEHLEDYQKPVSTIMKYPVITAHPLDFVEEVASVLYEHQINCLPIAEDDKFLGLITGTDILHTLVELTGAHQPSSQIEVKVPNISGQLAEIANILRENNVNVTSVLVYPHKDVSYKIITVRVQTMDPRGVIKAIKSKGFEIYWPIQPEPGL
ncbi:acetoin utilization AcuB family protein [Thalassorhabdus alkalitolerans]|uniref:Acetoin utilization AcuB family protein n=1 Tax=Thalassorhabdus alkalitolerans TaxID=2282697 RepID=A0ABW0YRS4_9BACI|nr:acetoin utilization AcuB family protein [Thalassobacillus sp. C254]